MDEIRRIKNLKVPKGRIDAVLDTDAFNEVDDQFAIAYLLRSKEKITTKALYAAPFFNDLSTGPADGMEKSYKEIFHILDLAGEKVDAFRGSDRFLQDEQTPVVSPAAEDLAKRAEEYSPENPLYVLTIGAITNIASAILLNPKVVENTVVVWLGGNADHYGHTMEFNMSGDVAAARVVMSSGVPFVRLPCMGVLSSFTISKPELEYWFVGKNPLADYLAKNTIRSADSYAKDAPWTRVIWDVTTVGWMLNDGDRFMLSRLIPTGLPSYDGYLTVAPDAHLSRYVYHIKRDALWRDVIMKISGIRIPEAEF